MKFDASQAILDVAIERKRQINEEGWHHDHDDLQDAGSLSRAGASYAWNASTIDYADTKTEYPPGQPPAYWPWGASAWKPKDRRRDLVRAAALILAEIERLDRAAARGET